MTTKKHNPSLLTKVFVPVASAFIIFLGGVCYHYIQNINVLPDKVRLLEHKQDSLNVLYNDWIAHLDAEVKLLQEQQK